MVAEREGPAGGSQVSLKPPSNPADPVVFDADRLTAVESDAAALLARYPTGTGSPEGAVSASPGASYQQTDGAEGATFWIKETGTGNTGWRLARRRFPLTLEFIAAEPRTSACFLGDSLQTTYQFPGDALSVSLQTFIPQTLPVTARLVKARWVLLWQPNATGCGVQLVHADSGPTNITQVHEFTGLSDTTPVASTAEVVDTLDDLVVAGARKFIGHRYKGNGSVAPRIYASRLELLFEG